MVLEGLSKYINGDTSLGQLLNQIIADKYVEAAVIFIGFYILAELLRYLSEKVILKLTKKTKTNLDDLIVKKIKRPISLLLIIIGARLGLIALELKGAIGDGIIKFVSSLTAIILIYIGVAVIKTLIEFWGESYAKKTKSSVDDNLVVILKKAFTILFFIAIFLAILKIWGVEIGPLLAGLGIGGLAVAFALQKSLGNIFGGISLILDKSIHVGDVVMLDKETKGTVLDIGLRSTKIRTFDNEVIIVPNGRLEDMNIQNIVKPEPSIRIVIPFGVAYGSKVDKVKKIVLKEINTIKGIDKVGDRAPIVRFLEMQDSALLFKAYFWIKTYEEKFTAIDEATTKIYDALNKARISIPFPQMDVHLKKR